MKTKDKKEIIDIFVNHRLDAKAKYKALVKVLLELKNSTPSQKRYYNASIYSAATLKRLEYDIKKLCSIKDSEVNSAVKIEKKIAIVGTPLTGVERLLVFNQGAAPDILRQEVIDLVEFSKLDELMPDPIPTFTKGLPGNAERKTWLKTNEVQHSFTKKDDLQKLIEDTHAKAVDGAYTFALTNLIEAQEALIKKNKEKAADDLEALNVNIFKEAPEVVKQGIKLRDRYPFLGEADCPDEFKILTADMITAYYNYVDGHKALKALVAAGASNEDIFEIAKKTVADFELNLEIGDELDYYLDHKEILGKHPIFADKMLAQKVADMGSVDLANRKKNLASYISRDSKAFKKMEAGEAKDAFAEKLAEWQKEQELVIARLEKIS